MVGTPSWLQQPQTLHNRSRVTESGHKIRSQPEGRHRLWTPVTRGFKILTTPTKEIVPRQTTCESNGNVYPAESREDYVVISNLIGKLINEELMKEEKERREQILTRFSFKCLQPVFFFPSLLRVDTNG